MDTAERAGWALSVAFSRDDLGFTDWNLAAAVLAGACALPGARGLEARALEQAVELVAERFRRAPPKPPLPAVSGEEAAVLEDLLSYTCASLRHGGLATTFVALAHWAAELAGRPLGPQERARLTRVVRSVLTVREIDRYLGALREAPEDLPEAPQEALAALQEEAMVQLEGIQPDQVFEGAHLAFVGEIIHGVIHACAVEQVLRLCPARGKMALNRLGEQLMAQRKLVETRAPQQFDELNEPASLDYLEVLGQGFDDPEKLLFACCARTVWEGHDRPDEWQALIGRTLAALE